MNNEEINDESTLVEEEATESYNDENDSEIEEEINMYSNEVDDTDLDIEEAPVSKKRSVRREILSWVEVIAVAILLALALNRYVIFSFTVPTPSMETTIMRDSRVMSLRCAYLFSEPKRGDIVVFPYPDDPDQNFIKRIIGMPGETIEGRDGLVYIDGEPLEHETYVSSEMDSDFGPYEVPKDSYFMMGDNRGVSMDSRYWENKFVKKKDIISKAIFQFYPKIGILK